MKRIRHLPMYVCLVILTLAFIWGNSLVPGDVSGEISGGVFEMVAGLFAVFGDKGQLVLRKLAHLTEYTALGFFLTGLWRNLKRREPVFFRSAGAFFRPPMFRPFSKWRSYRKPSRRMVASKYSEAYWVAQEPRPLRPREYS